MDGSPYEIPLKMCLCLTVLDELTREITVIIFLISLGFYGTSILITVLRFGEQPRNLQNRITEVAYMSVRIFAEFELNSCLCRVL